MNDNHQSQAEAIPPEIPSRESVSAGRASWLQSLELVRERALRHGYLVLAVDQLPCDEIAVALYLWDTVTSSVVECSSDGPAPCTVSEINEFLDVEGAA